MGFPSETDKEFKELLRFIEEVRFERLGAFVYSREEGTPAYDMPGQAAETVKNKRLGILMKDQRDISKSIQENFVGRTLRVMIDEKQSGTEGVYLGRSEYDAPDVDGLIYVHSDKTLLPGDFVAVKISDALEYDLVGATA